MNKYLVRSEEEYMAIFRNEDSLDVEEIVGVEFAYADGTYQSDIEYQNYESQSIDETQELQTANYRKHEDCRFPESYPCIVLFANDKDFDRTGSVQFKMLDFVYQSDFNP